jgi:hypothetical protein
MVLMRCFSEPVRSTIFDRSIFECFFHSSFQFGITIGGQKMSVRRTRRLELYLSRRMLIVVPVLPAPISKKRAKWFSERARSIASS